MWGTPVSDMQSGVTVSGTNITGTLKYLDTGVPAEYWGAGNFLNLKFTKDPDATSIKVGLTNSRGSGMVELDADMNAMLKISDKDTQKLKVVQSRTGEEKTWLFDLSGLVCETE